MGVNGGGGETPNTLQLLKTGSASVSAPTECDNLGEKRYCSRSIKSELRLRTINNHGQQFAENVRSIDESLEHRCSTQR